MLGFVAALDLQTAWTHMSEAGTEPGTEAGPEAASEAATLSARQPALEEEELACSAWQSRTYHAESSSSSLLVPPGQLS